MHFFFVVLSFVLFHAHAGGEASPPFSTRTRIVVLIAIDFCGVHEYYGDVPFSPPALALPADVLENG
jgi:hypothetical protein